MKKFSLNDILNDKSKDKGKRNEFNLQHIHISKLIPNEKNFYNVDDVEELKDNVLLLGLQQPLVVRAIEGTDTYILTSGHRRLKAISQLVEEGYTEFELVPCKVETEIDEIKNELRLISTNSTSRELSDYEKTHQAIRMKELLMALKQNGVKLPGRLRDIVAETMKISKTQVARMESIDNNLSPEFKEEFKNNNVNISTAYELSGLPQEEQQEALQEYKEKGSISIKEVKTIKNKPPPFKETTIVTVTREEVQEKEPEPVPFERPLNVYVCSPYGGLEENFKRAFEYCKYVAALGHIPFASHVMLHGIFFDDAYEQRLKGLQAGFEMIRIVDEVWVFSPEGDITKGMQQEIDVAKQLDKKIIYRSELNEQR